MTATGTWVVGLTLPCAPTPPLSMNDAKGMHWRQIRDRCDPWRDAVAWTAKSRRTWAHAFIAEHGLPLVVRLTIPFAVDRRRDAHNYTGTVCKAVIDGLVIARWVPDDTAAWIEVHDPLLTVLGLPEIDLLVKS